ncbi:GNAT family N-acetyltransferase [Candidatus Albibeggiatoa sp. nov. NOAA]|uniref:GNAT family N-acetyltransferase n=1 Tax=Candidatus Albibeggiatoa sp. nov. NOAA TaxID=3162724 RepID=UPI0032FB52B1|nr:GNAT family N-acetyltransferase [Thiotrichaceae bacterium]
MQVSYVDSLANLHPQQWNSLQGTDNPFLRHEFLLALEQHQCLHPYGWQPIHVAVHDKNNQLIGALPLYIKNNSYGEFVFDWAWASAYEHVLGQDYYPKLVSAIPYTPVTSQQLLIAPHVDYHTIADLLSQAALKLAQQLKVSSLHYLFTNQQDTDFLANQQNLMLRTGYQFHWHNQDYRDFQDYLDQFISKKRKQIRKERREAQNANLDIEILNGHTATEQHWQIFHDFYASTFDRKSGFPTLSLDFFQAISQTMPDNIVLVMAHQNGDYVAGAFNLCNEQTLYGRHWGCNQHFKQLHFELCYYQTLDFCIQNKLQSFEAGAQGLHKLNRGFLPTLTWSAHWIADDTFEQLVQRFLQHETPAIKEEASELLHNHSPFKK